MQKVKCVKPFTIEYSNSRAKICSDECCYFSELENYVFREDEIFDMIPHKNQFEMLVDTGDSVFISSTQLEENFILD